MMHYQFRGIQGNCGTMQGNVMLPIYLGFSFVNDRMIAQLIVDNIMTSYYGLKYTE